MLAHVTISPGGWYLGSVIVIVKRDTGGCTTYPVINRVVVLGFNLNHPSGIHIGRGYTTEGVVYPVVYDK